MSKPLIILFLFLSLNLTAQSAATLHIELAIENSKITITNANFESELIYPPNTKAQLVQLINSGFATLDSLIRNDSLQWCAEDGSCFPLNEFKADYLIFTQTEGVGEDVSFAYLDFIDSSDEEHWPLLELFSEHIFYIIQNISLNGSPINLIAKEFEEEDYEMMSFIFEIKPPINVDKTQLIWLDKDTIKATSKKRILKGLDGQLFFEKNITKRLDDYYTSLNFQPSYVIDSEKIRVLPPKISRFLITSENQKTINKAAYLLLPNKLYKAFLKIPKDSIKLPSLSGGNLYKFDILGHLNRQVSQLPILPSNNLAQFQAQLSQQGYALTLNPTPNESLDDLVNAEEQYLYVDLRVSQINQNEDTTNIVPATPNVVAGDGFADGVIEEDFNAADELEQKRQLTKFKRNFIGVGIDFYLNDETRLKTVFQRMMRDGSHFSMELAYAFNEEGFKEGGIVLSGSFSKDYLFFNALKKRLSLHISAGSDYTSNRIFANELFKERRTGGKIRTEIDWYRNQSNQLFQSYHSIADEQIILKNFENVATINTNLFSTEWGNIFFVTSPVKLFTTRFKLENSLKFGWADINQETPATFFSTSSIQANLNQKLVKGMALDFTAYTLWASKKAPTYEQIGHQIARNRGFKEDAIIGRNLWGATIEFWTPFPRFGNKNAKLSQYFYQHFRFAIFNDFSHYKNLLSAEKAIKLWSPGCGVRLIMGIAQVNFDWALSQTKTDELNGGSQFSLNLVLNSPFQ